MISLVLHEGSRYRPDDLTRLLLDGDAALGEEDARKLAKEVQEQLISLPLSSVVLGNSPVSEDSEADDLDSDAEDDQGVSLATQTRQGGIRLRHLVGSGSLQSELGSVQLEILPKVTPGDDQEASRAGLLRMWTYAADLNLRENPNTASMQDVRMPLHEWLIRRFLDQVDRLLARGIRAHYVEEEGNLATVRGRVLVRDNLRQNAFAPHRFYCRYEAFTPDRPENRLIRRAIDKIRARTQDADNRKRAAALAEWLHEIRPSTDVARDFKFWSKDRLMTHYQEIRPTCEWILLERAPTPTAGRQALFGRFVRMNDVFERYVTRWMQERMTQGHAVASPGEGQDFIRPLCKGQGGHKMQPDIRVHQIEGRSRRCTAVLDAKWKKAREDRKIASREDFYQMYAYASHWLRTQAKEESSPPDTLIGLVYPSVNPGDASIPFEFSELSDYRVRGASLKFLLPQRDAGAGGTNWREGFLLDGLTSFPEWMKQLAARAN